MAFELSKFTSALKGGGARSSLFHVTLTGAPTAAAGTSNNNNLAMMAADLKFLCKSTTIPPSTIASMEIPYLGRSIKVAGERTFENWSTTILNDENFQIRNLVEIWMDRIKSHSTIKQGYNKISDYKSSTLKLQQFDKAGTATNHYEFKNAWPVSVSEITLSWDNSAIEEYTVQWAYDYWTTGSITTTTREVHHSGTTVVETKAQSIVPSYPT
tara:strand:- start:58 stop:696 length:639 start_codon:yes stop_codon:yes gene_type:complete